MISELPEALLLQILSLLPTEDVAATSVLSKRWRTLWKVVPKLKFIHDGLTGLQTFSENVGKTLLSHKAPVLQSLHLLVSFDKEASMDLGVLIGIAFGLHVRELKLEVYCEEGLFTFPRSLYNCEKLETLKLVTSCGSILVDVPSSVCLKSLRTLLLHEVEYKDDESVVNLLSGCVSLENLVVKRKRHDVVRTFTIAVPSLQRLTITDQTNDSSYVIKAPFLKYLKIQGFSGLGSCLFENAPELVEANISIDYVISENILGSLTSAKHLSLNISPVECTFPAGKIFHQLAHLEICTYKAEWWNLLTLMLDTSPRLRVLKLIGGTRTRWDIYSGGMAWGKWIQPKNVPECLLFHLETFVLSVWTCHKGKLGDEKEVAKYVLKNASRLKKATLSKNDVNLEERVKLVDELESVVRASSSCQLVFE
ncbi:unnamed protein product [Microthlaspi erraticum]|uniref:F-box domain-containing protein n=1 Tax=Microthlaspi erraticum TaxID=1685480 RepID=A0A6D2JSJ6_9BRAS|nr:unnamed protein product [Microthlaspi erraticum]